MHTLHNATDQDWGIAFSPAVDIDGNPVLIPFSLHFSDLSLPPLAGIRVELYQDGPDAQPTSFKEFRWDETIGWMSYGIEEVYFRVLAVGDADAGSTYSVKFSRDTAANNGIVAKMGSTDPTGCNVWVGFSVDGMTGGGPGETGIQEDAFLGYRIKRNSVSLNDDELMQPDPWCTTCLFQFEKRQCRRSTPLPKPGKIRAKSQPG